MWFGGSLSATHEDATQKDEKEEQDDQQSEVSGETGDSSYTDEELNLEQRMNESFLTRAQRIQETESIDMELENKRFAMETRLYFVYFWLNHKTNWLKCLSDKQLDFLRDVLQLQKQTIQK